MLRAIYPLKRPVMVVSDYPLQNEVDRDIKYSGASNLDMLNGLAKAGIQQSDINCTYLSFTRPEGENYDFKQSIVKGKATVGSPLTFYKLEHQKDSFIEEELWKEFQALLEEIRNSEAKIIIVSGKWSFFFLTGLINATKTMASGKSDKPFGGLSTYRASICKAAECLNLPEILIYPILPPVTKHRMPELAPIMVWDSLKIGDIFKKVQNNEKTITEYIRPVRSILIGDTWDAVASFLNSLSESLRVSTTTISVDIETRHNTIDCIGIGFRNNEAMCIPFSTLSSPHFWTEEQEFHIVSHLTELLNHKNARIVGQNFSYDAQYIWRFWLTKLHAGFDTMIASHCLHNKMKKSLDFLASIYCEDYQYWKDMQDHSLEGVSK